MLKILGARFRTGIVTTTYPDAPAAVSAQARGAPAIDFAAWRDARPSAAACPTGAILTADDGPTRTVTFDLGRCIVCGLCADADPDGAVTMTPACELAVRSREALVTVARYELDAQGRQRRLLELVRLAAEPASSGPPPAGPPSSAPPSRASSFAVPPSPVPPPAAVVAAGEAVAARAKALFGRSLHVREVDAGSCNGCEVEITNLAGPVYDLERFGIHLVASPRHADLLLVTGPVTRNMEEPLRKTFEAMPPPRLVVAVGACGVSGGIFGVNYATRGGVDAVLPVDVYVPGCPPNPFALLQGLLLAMGRWNAKRGREGKSG